MTRVTTGCRLHFGLLRLPSAPDWADSGIRFYGGAGLMIEEPRLVVTVDRASNWNATGPLSARALGAARRYADARRCQDQIAVCVEGSPPEHVGLGVGTQLELAVAAGINRELDLHPELQEVARVMGRGKRSAVGVHGFALGGFIVDQGKRRPHELSGVERLGFPETWRVLVLTPPKPSPWFGEPEAAAFAVIGEQYDARMERLLCESMAPAIAQRDFTSFTSAVADYNRSAGRYYQAALRRGHADFGADRLIDWLTRNGAAGAGQSSWGPTAYGFFENPERAAHAARQAAADWPTLLVTATRARNVGASIMGTNLLFGLRHRRRVRRHFVRTRSFTKFLGLRNPRWF
jgi:beta-ribofuranosylaminobenzene 5'-phosphate synthase